METLFAVFAALFIILALEVVPAYLFYSMGGWPALALFLTLELVRLLISHLQSDK